MRWFLQLAVFALLLLLFALQFPRSALFFRPVRVPPIVPSVSLVTLDAAAYARIMRMAHSDLDNPFQAWQDGAMDSGAGMFAIHETLPPPAALPLPVDFARSSLPPAMPPARLVMPLKPPTLAAPPSAPPPAQPPAAKPPTEPVRPAADLLNLDDFDTLRERNEYQ
ncbi:MAG: hypothetical protein IKO72_03670 [Kiritimatiellae bacterium]|nr:hypothetical protein [Kiritimatiellia bacterium]